MPTQPDPLPLHEFSSADADTQSHLDALGAEIEAPQPSAAKIHEHVEHLRGIPAIGPALERWLLHPNTQLFITELTELGL